MECSGVECGAVVAEAATPVVEFVAGCFGGAVSQVVGQPLDTIRVRMQNRGADMLPRQKLVGLLVRRHLSSASRAYSWAQLKALFVGVASPLAATPLITACNFACYGYALSVLPSAGESHADYWTSGLRFFVAGTLSGLAQALVACPFECVKLVMQDERPNRFNSRDSSRVSTWACARRLVGERGVVALYRGFTCIAVRDGPGYGVYFCSYETVKRALTPSMGEPTSAFIAGGLAGVIGWCSTYGSDVLKTRMQMDVEGKKYRSTWHCLVSSLDREGPQFLVRGLGVTLLRAFPVHASLFMGYEFVKKLHLTVSRSPAPLLDVVE
ncbi:Solute carrier family 25 member 45 [Porphyridium purpureum]|uniref:Solute carrier family 25 member 45 n=1 Tax=Porphyridium purpureum TaxID=35688 RepID=A0A5J4YNB3_PORPP|nr:Solute carrier family 25 member 45 [Porphyridium purpureum]|eukprot:POR7262..scf222_8